VRDGGTEVERTPTKDVSPVVVRVKVHVEGIDVAVALIVHDDCSGDGVISLAAGVWFRAFDPFWFGGHVVVRSKVDVVAELVDVVLGQGLGRTGDFVEVYARRGVVEEQLDVRGEVFVLGVEVDDGCCWKSVPVHVAPSPDTCLKLWRSAPVHVKHGRDSPYFST
jgi:hypothetical protein